MLHTYIFIGRSGCGKGTQAELLRNRIRTFDLDKRPILYLETGDRFRHFIREDSYSAALARRVNDTGERQPDFLACWIWGGALVEELGENMHLVFDGAPRAVNEARVLTTALEFYKREQPTVIYINVSNKWSEEKLLARGRSDDTTLLKIDKRLDWFDKEVLPIIDYFKKEKLYRVIEVNGEQTIEKVHRDIVNALENTYEA